jgi:EAL domain-containing protein (putative c-di-GMP-specific phosphodiesterase class I)
MYLAKGLGRNRVEFFDEALRTKADRHLTTASALRRAVDRSEFLVYYQPIVDLGSGAIVGAEALVRWDRPEIGLVGPAEFVPLAEEIGLIVPIGAWVFEQACGQLVRWQRTSPEMRVAVNLSVRQVSAPEIVDQIEGVLERYQLHPDSVCLELTESVFMEDAAYFGRTLADLKRLGVTLSIDDFGTGFSSLNYLKHFPVDEVKVDRAFVDGLGTDDHDTSLVAALVSMAGALQLDVTAEGIETQDQLAHLRKLECPRGQGFLFARPMPAEELEALVLAGHRWPVD